MVLWDVMAAHHRMRAWLSSQLRATAARAATLDQVPRFDNPKRDLALPWLSRQCRPETAQGAV